LGKVEAQDGNICCARRHDKKKKSHGSERDHPETRRKTWTAEKDGQAAENLSGNPDEKM